MVENKSLIESNQNVKIFDSTFWVLISLFCCIITIICFLPYWLTIPSNSLRLDFTDTGEIGDTIGGTMGPFIAIAAALLTFIAFWVQYKANKQQALQFEKQASDASIERFENKYYELIRIQRENLNEIEIAFFSNPNELIRGRKVFIYMFLEFRFIYAKLKLFIEEYNKNELGFREDDEETVINIAYHLFFMGIGDNSDKLILESLSGFCEQQFLIDLIINLETSVKNKYRKNSKEKFEIKLKDIPNTLEYTSKYLPLGGHISRLGHYYRHLFQTVKYVSEQDEKLINEEKKCEYVKTIRAQLSDYEQLILYYNIISNLGKSWTSEKENFVKRFRIIKNMPIPLADFSVLPRIRFAKEIDFWRKKGKSFFEWDERIYSTNN